jgi:hypothetical protein
MSGIMNMFVAAKTTVATAIDEFFNRVTLLLNTSSTNGAQNNTFLDSSSNNFTITRNGNTTQGTFTPFSQTGWGNYIAGTSDYIKVASNAAYGVGTGNFTLEAFFYVRTLGTVKPFTLGNVSSEPIAVTFTATNIRIDIAGSTSIINVAQTIPLNSWNHIAFVRSGTGSGQVALYLNGSRITTGTSSGSISASDFQYGGIDWTGGFGLVGHYSNVRYSNTARYSGTTYTVPTEPFTSDANTLVLAAQSNRFVNTSSYGGTVTVSGASVQSFSPFDPTAAYDSAVVGGSGYFDGTGDYLSVADDVALQFGSGTFTINCWVYRSVAGVVHTIASKGASTPTGWVFQINASNQLVFTHTSTNITSTATIPAGSWTYVSVVRSGTGSGQTAIYINAGSSVTGTVSTNFNQTTALNIGTDRSTTNNFNGYISGFEYIKGSAITPALPTVPPTTTNSPSLLTNFTNAGIFDSTAKNNLETVGNAQVSTTQAKFGTTSMSFDGTGDWLLMPDSPNLQLLTGDFTIDGWVYINTAGVAYGIVSKGTATTGWSVNVTSGNKLQFSYTATQLTGATSLAATTWYYFAVVRSGSATGNLKVYLDGSVDATSGGAVTDNFNQTSSMYVGASRTGTTALNGYLDEVRVTKGVARDVTTVPTAVFSVQ